MKKSSIVYFFLLLTVCIFFQKVVFAAEVNNKEESEGETEPEESEDKGSDSGWYDDGDVGRVGDYIDDEDHLPNSEDVEFNELPFTYSDPEFKFKKMDIGKKGNEINFSEAIYAYYKIKDGGKGKTGYYHITKWPKIINQDEEEERGDEEVDHLIRADLERLRDGDAGPLGVLIHRSVPKTDDRRYQKYPFRYDEEKKTFFFDEKVKTGKPGGKFNKDDLPHDIFAYFKTNNKDTTGYYLLGGEWPVEIPKYATEDDQNQWHDGDKGPEGKLRDGPLPSEGDVIYNQFPFKSSGGEFVYDGVVKRGNAGETIKPCGHTLYAYYKTEEDSTTGYYILRGTWPADINNESPQSDEGGTDEQEEAKGTDKEDKDTYKWDTYRNGDVGPTAYIRKGNYPKKVLWYKQLYTIQSDDEGTFDDKHTMKVTDETLYFNEDAGRFVYGEGGLGPSYDIYTFCETNDDRTRGYYLTDDVIIYYKTADERVKQGKCFEKSPAFTRQEVTLFDTDHQEKAEEEEIKQTALEDNNLYKEDTFGIHNDANGPNAYIRKGEIPKAAWWFRDRYMLKDEDELTYDKRHTMVHDTLELSRITYGFRYHGERKNKQVFAFFETLDPKTKGYYPIKASIAVSQIQKISPKSSETTGSKDSETKMGDVPSGPIEDGRKYDEMAGSLGPKPFIVRNTDADNGLPTKYFWLKKFYKKDSSAGDKVMKIDDNNIDLMFKEPGDDLFSSESSIPKHPLYVYYYTDSVDTTGYYEVTKCPEEPEMMGPLTLGKKKRVAVHNPGAVHTLGWLNAIAVYGPFYIYNSKLNRPEVVRSTDFDLSKLSRKGEWDRQLLDLPPDRPILCLMETKDSFVLGKADTPPPNNLLKPMPNKGLGIKNIESLAFDWIRVYYGDGSRNILDESAKLAHEGATPPVGTRLEKRFFFIKPPYEEGVSLQTEGTYIEVKESELFPDEPHFELYTSATDKKGTLYPAKFKRKGSVKNLEKKSATGVENFKPIKVGLDSLVESLEPTTAVYGPFYISWDGDLKIPLPVTENPTAFQFESGDKWDLKMLGLPPGKKIFCIYDTPTYLYLAKMPTIPYITLKTNTDSLIYNDEDMSKAIAEAILKDHDAILDTEEKVSEGHAPKDSTMDGYYFHFESVNGDIGFYYKVNRNEMEQSNEPNYKYYELYKSKDGSMTFSPVTPPPLSADLLRSSIHQEISQGIRHIIVEKDEIDWNNLPFPVKKVYGPFCIDWDNRLVSAVKKKTKTSVNPSVGARFDEIKGLYSQRGKTFYCIAERSDENNVVHIFRETVVREKLCSPDEIINRLNQVVLKKITVPKLILMNHKEIHVQNSESLIQIVGAEGLKENIVIKKSNRGIVDDADAEIPEKLELIGFPYLRCRLSRSEDDFFYAPNEKELEELEDFGLNTKSGTELKSIQASLYALYSDGSSVYSFHLMNKVPDGISHLTIQSPLAGGSVTFSVAPSPPPSYRNVYGPFYISSDNELVSAVRTDEQHQESEYFTSSPLQFKRGTSFSVELYDLPVGEPFYCIYEQEKKGGNDLVVVKTEDVPDGLQRPSRILSSLNIEVIKRDIVPILLENRYKEKGTIHYPKGDGVRVFEYSSPSPGAKCTIFPLKLVRKNDGEEFFYEPTDLRGYTVGQPIPEYLQLYGFFQKAEDGPGSFYLLKKVPPVHRFEKSLPSSSTSTSTPEDPKPPMEREKPVLTSYQQEEYDIRHATMDAITRATYDRDQYMNPNFLSVSSSPESIDSPLVIIMNWMAQIVYIILAGSGVCLLIGGMSQLNLKSIIGIGVIVRFILFSMSLLVRSTRTNKHLQNRLAKLHKKD